MSETFWRKLRVALAAGPIHSESAPQPDLARGRFFESQLSQDERIKLFSDRAASCASSVHSIRGLDALAEIIRENTPANAVILLDPALPLSPSLGQKLAGHARPMNLDRGDDETLFAAHTAVTGVDFAIAETGSVVISAPRRLPTTVAQVHFALIRPDQIVPDLMDLPAALAEASPNGFTIISGPSKTADIEMNLVVGVHGPAQMHLVVFEE